MREGTYRSTNDAYTPVGGVSIPQDFHRSKAHASYLYVRAGTRLELILGVTGSVPRTLTEKENSISG